MVNRVILLGRIGRDPELKYTAQQMPVLRLSIATTERFKAKDNTMQESTEWHQITAFGKRFEALSKYLQKGALIYVEGKIVTRSYEKDGIKRYSTEILVNDIQLCSGGVRKESPTNEIEFPELDKSGNLPSPRLDFNDMEIPF